MDLDLALAHARRSGEKLANDTNIMDTLGLIYVKKNLTEDGCSMLREMNRKPENSAFHLHLALAHYQEGDRPGRKELGKRSSQQAQREGTRPDQGVAGQG